MSEPSQREPLAGFPSIAEWQGYEQRPERLEHRANRLAFPEWQGEPLAGKSLLIWAEQGYGDQIMAARFIPLLGAQSITYSGTVRLQRLFAQLPVTYSPLGQTIAILRHDYWILPMSLPLRFGVTEATLPSEPYLRAESRAKGGIGIAWSGNEIPSAARSLPAALGHKLLRLPGAVSLHPQDSGAQDFMDTAEIIAGLDLVITIDTSVAHLAGAMGKPCWLLLRRFADWRWMRDRADSPWYPSMRLFRQLNEGDWESVLNEVMLALEARDGEASCA
ncbi:MAG: hypothetical protein ABW360_07915 [Phenylobacterium sp.]